MAKEMVTMQTNYPSATVDGKGPTKKAPKSILQPKPKYNLKPALVTPEKKESSTKEEPIPRPYVETIKTGFGESADIFKDVLCVDKDAKDRDIRIAYFRRGREILAEGGFRTLDQAATVSDVSTNVRTRFQAVSMAYEIASNARWKKYYLQNGLVSVDDDASVDSSDPVSGSAASLPGSRPAVRWNGHVEELLFEKEPDEHKAVISNSKKSNKKKRVVVESGHLDEHLQKLDEEASQHFVTDFWDSLEESLDGLLRMASGDEKKSERDSPNISLVAKDGDDDYGDDDDDDSVKSDATPFDEDPNYVPARLPQASNPAPARLPHASNPAPAKPPQASYPPPKPLPTQTRSRDPPTGMKPSKAEDTQAAFRPITPETSRADSSENLERTASNEAFEVDSISFSGGSEGFHEAPSENVSKSPEGSDGFREVPDEQLSRDPPGESRKYDDDIFEGLDDDAPKHIALLRVRSESPSTDSVSELTATTRTVASATRSSDRNARQGGTRGTDEATVDTKTALKQDDICDTMLHPEKIIGSLTNYMTPGGDGEETVDSGDPIKKEDDFVQHLVAYISAIVHDCAGKISEIQWDNTVLGAFMVDENGLSKMMCTVETEMKKTPEIDAVDVISSPSFDAIEAVRSFG